MTIKEYIEGGVERLLPLYAREEAKALLGMALEHFCHLPLYTYYTNPHQLLPASSVVDLQRALDELSASKPIQYILGYTLFEGCTLHVREGVLIPRPETAEMVRRAKGLLSEGAADSVLDLCTGSGAMAISIAKAFPNVKVYGVDISEAALEVAHENSLLNNVEVCFYKADILQPPDLIQPPLRPHSFDLIISNPPYVRLSERAAMHPNVLLYEPHIALFVPDTEPLRFYHAITDWAIALLKDGGTLMAEINEWMDTAVADLLRSKGFSSIEVRRDINGKQRVVAACWDYSLSQAPKCSS